MCHVVVPWLGSETETHCAAPSRHLKKQPHTPPPAFRGAHKSYNSWRTPTRLARFQLSTQDQGSHDCPTPSGMINPT